MSHSKALDEILHQQGEFDKLSVEGPDILTPEFCEYWPQTRAFLEWAKTQTKKEIVILILTALITLGNRTCAGAKS